jgi:hypothetical protein
MLDELKSRITAAIAYVERTFYSTSGKRWFVGGIYAELEMALIVKCFSTFPPMCKENVSVDEYNTATSTLISSFVCKMQVPEISTFNFLHSVFIC